MRGNSRGRGGTGGGITKRRKKNNHSAIEPPRPPRTVLSAKAKLMSKTDNKGAYNKKDVREKQLAKNIARANLYKNHVDIL